VPQPDALRGKPLAVEFDAPSLGLQILLGHRGEDHVEPRGVTGAAQQLAAVRLDAVGEAEHEPSAGRVVQAHASVVREPTRVGPQFAALGLHHHPGLQLQPFGEREVETERPELAGVRNVGHASPGRRNGLRPDRRRAALGRLDDRVFDVVSVGPEAQRCAELLLPLDQFISPSRRQRRCGGRVTPDQRQE
jgi:hypothetical protein